MEQQEAIILAINPHIKVGQGNSVGGKGSKEQAKESEAALLPLLDIPHDDQDIQP